MMIDGTDLAKKIGRLAEAKQDEVNILKVVGISELQGARIEGYTDALKEVLLIMKSYAS